MDATKRKYDAIIIGGGHNSLVCAAYLAKGGLKPLVLEQRHVLGGACVTEDFDGCKISRAAYVYSLFHPKIVKDLGLYTHGLRLLERNPPSFTPLRDGGHLFLYNEMEKSQKEIAKFSKKDAKAYPDYEATLDRIARFTEKVLFMTPPDPQGGFVDNLRTLNLLRKAKNLGDDFSVLEDLFTKSANDFVTNYFESEPLISTLSTDGIIGAGGPYTDMTAYVLLHHVMGEVNGYRGRWGYVRGGMGGLTTAIEQAGRKQGAEYRTGADVKKILIDDGKAQGVVLKTGDEIIMGDRIISGADPRMTFEMLLPPNALPDDFLKHVRRIDYSSATSKINMTLDGPLTFTQHFTQHKRSVPGTFHICENNAYINRSYQAALNGELADDLVLEGCVPSIVDETLAPRGRHVLSLLVQYTPYKLAQGNWDDRKDELLQKTVSTLASYTNIKDVLREADVLTPLDLERTFRLAGGNLFHGGMGISQIFHRRPVPKFAKYKTPIKNLWLCGSATHPGGGVTGIPGHNAAREILNQARSPLKRLQAWTH